MSKVKIKYKGITLAILSVVAIAFLIFNTIFQTFEFILKYQAIGYILFFASFIFSVVYAFIENKDGKGW